MLSLKKGRKIAIIKIKGNRKKEYIYINENDIYNSESDDNKNKNDKTLTTNIKIKNGRILPLPNTQIVEKIYISAPSGAGKSTFISNWINEALKMKQFKNDDVILFSSIEQDEVLDKHDPLRVELNEELIENPLNGEDVKNSIVIFDDTDTIQCTQINKAVLDFKNYLLEQGRHFNTRLLITSHILSDREKTKRTLNEATAICLFPRSGTTELIKKFLKDKLGFSKKQIKKMLNLKSRWVCIYKTAPMYIISEREIYILNDGEESDDE